MTGDKVAGRYINYTFSHDSFRRDQPELCSCMQRMTRKDWKAGRRPKRKSKAEVPLKSPQSNELRMAQQINGINQLLYPIVMPQIQPVFVPVIQPVPQPWPMQMQPFFMRTNQFSTREPVVEVEQLSAQPLLALLKPQPAQRQVPKPQHVRRQHAAKPRQHTTRITLPKNEEKVKEKEQKKEVSLTKDELSAVIGMAMLDDTD